ncbi:MAG TPA: hypothetical protein IGS17_14990 [Oscillatoriales cyanobacterium M59_W2019_021]|nr:hypothetical protein [Oscillatoriales cyanobacterium M59_W2019_021]
MSIILSFSASASEAIPNRSQLVPPQIAQRSSGSEIEARVYEQLPDLPLENEYVSQETGEVNPNSTLIGRLIRYHIYVKGRPPQYRLDWKLTLADYLGKNELMFEGVYPGSEDLRDNPMMGDREAIRNLTRSQRNALVHTLVSLYNPQYLQLLEEAARTSEPTAEPTFENDPPRQIPQPPRPPQPGDADLLNP